MNTQEEHDAETERLAIERRRMVQVIAEHAQDAADLTDLVELLGLEVELEELREQRNGSDETVDERSQT